MSSIQTYARLHQHDLEHLVMTIEKALEIQTRAQFFLWAQGALQGFLAHEALWCAHGDIENMRMRFESFSRAVPCARLESQMVHPADGLLPRLVDEWLRGGRVPRVCSSEETNQTGRRQLIADLQRAGFDHVMVHGVKEIQGEHGSFFVFAGMDHLPDAHDSYVLELLLPHLHLALHRMLPHPEGRTGTEVAPAVLLSRREIQVLHWVRNGKTNQEIGQILGICAPTVKNHLQKIMRKLNVTNRAQAVGKGATLRLVAHTDPV